MITTDSVGAFAELSLCAGTLLVWAPATAQLALQQMVQALPPKVQWSHLLTSPRSCRSGRSGIGTGPAASSSCQLVVANRLAPIMAAYAQPLTDSRPWEPSRIPKPLLAVCSSLVESNGGLSAEVCALAPAWHAIG